MPTEHIDALEFFNDLAKRKEKESADRAKFPGSTPPRNSTSSLDSQPDSWLNSLSSLTYSVNGVERKFYTIGSLCAALGNKPVTIRSWESKGWLPKPKFRTPPPRGSQIPGKAIKGRRLYTMEQVVFIVETYERFIVVPKNPNWDGFRTHIRQHYPTS